MRSSNNTTNAEALIFPVTVVKLKTRRVILTAFYTAEFAFISPDPLP